MSGSSIRANRPMHRRMVPATSMAKTREIRRVTGMPTEVAPVMPRMVVWEVEAVAVAGDTAEEAAIAS
jgi:hypothetical protein